VYRTNGTSNRSNRRRHDTCGRRILWVLLAGRALNDWLGWSSQRESDAGIAPFAAAAATAVGGRQRGRNELGPSDAATCVTAIDVKLELPVVFVEAARTRRDPLVAVSWPPIYNQHTYHSEFQSKFQSSQKATVTSRSSAQQNGCVSSKRRHFRRVNSDHISGVVLETRFRNSEWSIQQTCASSWNLAGSDVGHIQWSIRT